MKKLLSFILALCFLFSMTGCSFEQQFDIDGAAVLKIMSGNTGTTVEITDSEVLDAVTENITGLSYEKKGKVESDGWIYNLRWYSESGEELFNLSITEENGHQIVHKGHYYIVSDDLNIDMEIIEAAYNGGLQ